MACPAWGREVPAKQLSRSLEGESAFGSSRGSWGLPVLGVVDRITSPFGLVGRQTAWIWGQKKWPEEEGEEKGSSGDEGRSSQ